MQPGTARKPAARKRRAPAGELRGNLVPPGRTAGAAGDQPLSFRRNDNSTAFFSHWLTFQESGPSRRDFLGDPRLAAVEQAQRPLDRVAHVAVVCGLIWRDPRRPVRSASAGWRRHGVSGFVRRRGFGAGAADVNGGEGLGIAWITNSTRLAQLPSLRRHGPLRIGWNGFATLGGRATEACASPRSLRTPLFAHKVVSEAVGRMDFSPDEALLRVAAEYARKAKRYQGREGKDVSAGLHRRGADQDPWLFAHRSRQCPIRLPTSTLWERGRSIQRSGTSNSQAMSKREPSRRRSSSKGQEPADLDRHARPRQPGAAGLGLRRRHAGAWVLVSNCLEIRLYGFGRGRELTKCSIWRGSTNPKRSTRGSSDARRPNACSRGAIASCARPTAPTRTSPRGSTRNIATCATG